MSTLNTGVAPATHMHGATAEGMASSHPPLQRVASAAPPQCGDGRPAETVSAVIITFDDSYLKTLPGILRMVQVVNTINATYISKYNLDSIMLLLVDVLH